MDNVSIKVDKDKLVIEIPINELIQSQEDRQIGYKIVNTEKMLDWLKENLLKCQGDRWELALDQFVDNVFNHAYASAEGWLEGQIL